MELNDEGSQPEPKATQRNSVESLAKLWAKRYIRQLGESDETWEFRRSVNTRQLRKILRSTSARAWHETEVMLAEEVRRHGIDEQFIDPWEISQDSYSIYDKAFAACAELLTPQRFSRIIANDVGRIRQKYTADDPRVLGFVSMQFHRTEQLLLEEFSPAQQTLMGGYFKVIDDHLYMPLQYAYKAAARHNYDSPVLQAIRKLLPVSSEIARKIVLRSIELYPNYRSYTDLLGHPKVRISSIRDAEMFQVYLWVCALEQGIIVLQHELFPLCVMLYPALRVSWELVRLLIHLLYIEMQKYLEPQLMDYLMPYWDSMWDMFSVDVLL